MAFAKKPALNILTCNTCKSTGSVGVGRCPECHGMAMGHHIRDRWLYWGYPLTRYHLAVARARRIFKKLRFLVVLILLLNCWFWFGWKIYQTQAYLALIGKNSDINLFLHTIRGGSLFLFFFGIVLLSYLVYRSITDRAKRGAVEAFEYDYVLKNKIEEVEPGFDNWKQARAIRRSRRLDIARAFTEEALIALGGAYRLADKNNHSAVTPIHLFMALLDSNRVSNIFVRLGLPASMLRQKMAPLFNKTEKMQSGRALVMPLVSPEFAQAIFQSYESAYAGHQDYVSVTELLVSAVEQSPELQEMLFDFNVNNQKLANVVEWTRIRERLLRRYNKFRRAAGMRSKSGIDRAMTAIATPYLNSFSQDLTLLAQLGNLDTCVAREKEIEEIFRVVEGGGKNVILVGDQGTGKRSVVEGLAEKMISGDVPKRLQDKRLVRLGVSSLLAGTTPAGAVERLQNIMYEIARAGNVELFIHNIHELVGVSTGGGEGHSLDVADTMAESLNSGRFFTIATTTTEDYARFIANSPLGGVFTKIEVGEMDENQAIQVLESKVGYAEYKHNVFFSYDALEKAVTLCKKFIHEIYLPGSALDVMNEVAAYTHSKKGTHSLVTAEEVAVVVAEKSKVPVTTVSADESTKLMKLEEEMHKRVIGQDEAVELVANALRRARAEMRASNRPIANFLFLGPTGVGKTELAKTIAEIYFGGESKIIRLDMSEYQDKASIYRLIGAPGEKGSGILTEAVRRAPFALVLLDEIEKADKDVLNLFLQVMDDGRLSDSTGRVADFTNVILIATSNAGTAYVQDQLRAGLSSEAIRERLLHGELRDYFRPEFLNRFDGIVLFKAIDHEGIKKIAGLMLKSVAKNLETKGIFLEVTPGALEFLANVGFDPEFGARPMRRAIQERVENHLAELLLSGKIKRRDTVIINDSGLLEVKK